MAAHHNFSRAQLFALGWAHLAEGVIAILTLGWRLPMLSIRLALWFTK